MSKLQSRVEKLEGANPALRYTVIEHIFYEPTPDGPRATGSLMRRDLVTGQQEWIGGAEL